MNIPGKIFFGDGLRWTAVISLPIKRVDGRQVMDCRKVPSYVAEFFSNLPVLMGLGVGEDCRLTEEIVTLLTGIPINLRLVDIGAVATLAGYDGGLSMTTLGITILGGAFNKSVSRGDLMWDKEYGQLPAPLQAYMVADIRFGHYTFNVLLSCLLRELYPDPEVAAATR